MRRYWKKTYLVRPNEDKTVFITVDNEHVHIGVGYQAATFVIQDGELVEVSPIALEKLPASHTVGA
jgi:hypothetical protein